VILLLNGLGSVLQRSLNDGRGRQLKREKLDRSSILALASKHRFVLGS